MRRQLGVGGLFSETRRSQCHLWRARDRRRVGGTVPPAVVLVLSFDKVPLWVAVCFLGERLGKRLFKESLAEREGDLECRLKLSMKVPVCGG